MLVFILCRIAFREKFRVHILTNNYLFLLPLIYCLSHKHINGMNNNLMLGLAIVIMCTLLGKMLVVHFRKRTRFRSNLSKESWAIDFKYSYVLTFTIVIILFLEILSNVLNNGTINFVFIAIGFSLSILVFLLLAYMVLQLALSHFKNQANNSENSTIAKQIRKYKPEYALYFAAPKNTDYQWGQWVKYLQQIDKKFIIVCRELANYKAFVKYDPSLKVVYIQKMRNLDVVYVDSLKVVFYVNNGKKNNDIVRNGNLVHILLLHGESDKASSFNPISKNFTKLYVAGRVGMERYWNHGIDIPQQQFEIIGRPQVEEVEISKSVSEISTVLYAPTWHGNDTYDDFCSLPKGVKIIQNLLDKELTVIFRPHPYSYRNRDDQVIIKQIFDMLRDNHRKTGKNHVFGRKKMEQLSTNDCFNMSDMLVGDASSVIYDFLYSEKPIVLVSVRHTLEEFDKEFAVAKAAYVVDNKLTGLSEILDNVINHDTKRAKRIQAKRDILGDFAVDDPEHYSSYFVNIARKEIENASVNKD
jgi:hypothetical protein